MIKECLRFASVPTHQEFLKNDDNWDFQKLKLYISTWWGQDYLEAWEKQIEAVANCMMNNKQQIQEIARTENATTSKALKDRFNPAFKEIKSKLDMLKKEGFEVIGDKTGITLSKLFWDYDLKKEQELVSCIEW